MNTTYRVKIWNLKPRKNKDGKVTSYGVYWEVDGKRYYQSHKVRAQADSFRSGLISAQRRGEPFDRNSGRPVSSNRGGSDVTWFDFACEYVDMKWPGLAATSRQGIAEALIRITPVFVPAGRNAPPDTEIRSVLRQWGFNASLRESDEVPDRCRHIVDWCSRNTMPLRSIEDPVVQRAVQKAATTKLNGQPFAPTVVRKTRSVLTNALDYAVERNLLAENPLTGTKWSGSQKATRAIDRRAVPNPVQARTLLAAVRDTRRSGARLEAFFAALYFAALRPEEAVALTRRNLDIPATGWGELHLDAAHPHAGARWTDGNRPRDRRQLKARAVGEGRTVPCPPELTAILHRHLAAFGFGDDGRIFHGEKGGDVPLITYTRTWRAARARALTPEACASPLARRPYDLRHAAVSTWLNGGVPATTVARWAGHSVAVLLEVYAACLHGQDALARRQVEAALGDVG